MDITDLLPATWDALSKDALISLFEQAKRENLWFFHGGMCGPVWFSPAEMTASWAKGEFVWGAGNWRLRNPQERLHEIEMQRAALTTEYLAVKHRIATGVAK